ncbi:MAG: amidohydrolase family protein, partial [Anaeroplasmataceae bacterium]|nr:amidohydrolase family protein [Anaeroplasmataceae bacterium]
MKNYVLKGDICYSKDLKTLECIKDGYLVCVDQKSMGVFESLPEEYKNLPIKDYKNHLIVPGLIDLHLHAPQFPFRGSKMDLELLDWLKENAFLEEMKYSDLEYAKKSYKIFVEAMKKSATTRACIFASRHKDATKLLCEMLEQTGLITYVGKVNMDREAPEALLDKSVEEYIKETEELILFNKNLKRTK